jgi:ABC-type nitrate/sulfonate/bicarbonate transport system permease component
VTAPPIDAPPTTLPAAREGRWWERLDGRTRVLLVAVEMAIVLIVWQVAIAQLGLVSHIFLPPPLDIASGFGTLLSRDDMSQHILTSLGAWCIGYGLATVVGIAVGVAVGGSLPVERLSGPVLWTLYATPWLAYRPLSVVWFGFGTPPIIFLVFIAALFPVLLNTAAGVRAVEPSLLQAGQVFGIGRIRTYMRIMLPSALPFVIVGMRQSAVMATISLIVAEMTGSSIGLGALISILTSRYQTDQTFALVAIAVVWTVLFGQLLRVIGNRLAPWRTDARLT